MLGRKLLDADSFPDVQIRTTEISGEMEDLKVLADVSIGGRERSIGFGGKVIKSEDQLTISGSGQLSKILD